MNKLLCVFFFFLADHGLTEQHIQSQGSQDREKSGKSRELCKCISRPRKSREKYVLV